MYCRAVGNMLKIDIKVRASENILVKTGTNCNIVFCIPKNVSTCKERLYNVNKVTS